MDESLLELENELKRLSPRRPSRAMLAALERELAQGQPSVAAEKAVRDDTATTVRSWNWALWSLAGAAAALAVAFALHSAFDRSLPQRSTPEIARQADGSTAPAAAATVAPDRYEPVQASSVLYAMHESPPTKLPDRTEAREVRYRFVDTYTWKNPARNASVRWSVPRDEVRFIRANLD